MTTFHIPNCCALPAHNREGVRHCCLTCFTTYMVIGGQWVATDPIVDLHPFEHVLDEGERHGD